MALKDKSRGKFAADEIPVSRKDSLAMVGAYRGTVHDAAGNALYEGDLKLRADLTWELRHIKVLAPGLPALTGGAAHRLAGRFAVAGDGRVLLNLSRVPLRFRTQPAAGSSAARALGITDPAEREVPPGGGASAAPAAARHRPPVERSSAARPRPAAVDETFADATFDAGWDTTVLIDTSPGMSGFAEGFQVSDGGNSGTMPDPFRQVEQDGDAFSVVAAHVFKGRVLAVPAGQSVQSIDYSCDLRQKSPGPGVTAYRLLVQRDNGSHPGGGRPGRPLVP